MKPGYAYISQNALNG